MFCAHWDSALRIYNGILGEKSTFLQTWRDTAETEIRHRLR